MIAAFLLVPALLAQAPPVPAEATLQVDASQTIHRLSPLIYGACIEDVNHEIYGGFYSQMIFGEGFQEPPPPVPIRGFRTLGGNWRVQGDSVTIDGGSGPKLIREGSTLGDGTVAVDVRFAADRPGNAGLIVRAQDRAEVGADAWTGYEVSLESRGRVVLGRHRRNWEPLREVDWPVPIGSWVRLAVRLDGPCLTVSVGGQEAFTFEDRDHPLASGRVGLRCWQRPAEFRDLRVGPSAPGEAVPLVAEPTDPLALGVSGMWRPVRKGDVQGTLSLDPVRPFQGAQSQRITFAGGAGEIGVANMGLNRWGLNLVEGKPYEGVVWLRSEAPTSVLINLEAEGRNDVLASARVDTPGGDWTRHVLSLTPKSSDPKGRLGIKLDSLGSVCVGYASLQPGEWGRFQGLPVRRDVAEGLRDQGVSILRYGGSMVNHPAYRWKNMVGPRDRRPATSGHWYPYSTNGWGIPDFLNLCEALGIPGIPAFHMGESPQDMADFVQYANGPANSPWGRQRVRDGHPEPYRLKALELGNEEVVDLAYFARFRAMAEAIWAVDPTIIPVVGDFVYHQIITDPDHIAGSDGAKSLAGHRQILEFARERGQEVWFDIHTGTDHPPEPNGLRPERSYVDQLDRLAPGSKHKVVIFEYNSGNHRQRRALSNALATLEVERIGGDRLPIACAANGLQPDGQNDNGWDQGLLFLNPTTTWLQPPGHLTRMTRRAFQPILVGSTLVGPGAGDLSATAKRSDDGRTLVVQVVNPTDRDVPLRLALTGFAPAGPGTFEQLAGPLDARNTADNPNQIQPTRGEYRAEGATALALPARSITVLTLPGALR